MMKKVRVIGKNPWTGKMEGYAVLEKVVNADTVAEIQSAIDGTCKSGRKHDVLVDGQPTFVITEDMLKEAESVDILSPIAGG